MAQNFDKMILKKIFKIGQNIRNPSIRKWFNFLKSSEKWSLKELEDYQLIRLKEILKIAYSNSAYYKLKFDKVGVKPSDLKFLDDLKKFPIITKNELIEQSNNIHTNIKFSKYFKANTSGTSGQSLNFKRDESADSFNRASIFRGYSWYNVNPWELSGYFWGYNFTKFQKFKTQLLDFLQNRIRLFSYDTQSVVKFLKKINKATFISGYASMIYEVAKIINTKQLERPNKLKMLVGTSEKIQESYQDEVQKVFGLKIISEYGATESGIIAFECPCGNMHINMEGVIVEEIENEIVVTNLQMKSFPIIRYKLGDYIKLSKKNNKCKCGLNHLILDDVVGRIGSMVYGINNKYPSLVFYYIFKNLAKKNKLNLNYQVIQEKKGLLHFLIAQKLKATELKLIKNEIQKYFKNDIKFKIVESYNFNIKSEKNKSFISKVE